jgi:hypothetical protein
MDAVMAVKRGDPGAEQPMKRDRRVKGRVATRKVEQPKDIPARSDVSVTNPVPTPPFWGDRIVKGVPLADFATYLDERATFMGQWGLKSSRGDGPSYEELVETEGRPRLRDWMNRIQTESIMEPAVVYGYWPCYSDGNDLVVLDADRQADEVARFSFPRQQREYGGPREVHFYDSLAQVPVDQIDPQLRLLLDFTSVNNEIASVHWAFELEGLRRLRHGSLRFTDATLETVERVQQCFVAGSPDAQRFIEGYQAVGHRPTRLIPH